MGCDAYICRPKHGNIEPAVSCGNDPVCRQVFSKPFHGGSLAEFPGNYVYLLLVVKDICRIGIQGFLEFHDDIFRFPAFCEKEQIFNKAKFKFPATVPFQKMPCPVKRRQALPDQLQGDLVPGRFLFPVYQQDPPLQTRA